MLFKIMKKKKNIWKVIFIIIAIEGLLENIYIDISLNLIVIFWSELLSMKKKVKSKITIPKKIHYIWLGKTKRIELLRYV